MPKQYPSVPDKRAAMKAQAARSAAVLGRGTKFELIANTMAAGPCEHCTEAAKHIYTLSKLPLMPLKGCPHPDQCVGFCRSVV